MHEIIWFNITLIGYNRLNFSMCRMKNTTKYENLMNFYSKHVPNTSVFLILFSNFKNRNLLNSDMETAMYTHVWLKLPGIIKVKECVHLFIQHIKNLATEIATSKFESYFSLSLALFSRLFSTLIFWFHLKWIHSQPFMFNNIIMCVRDCRLMFCRWKKSSKNVFFFFFGKNGTPRSKQIQLIMLKICLFMRISIGL